MNVSRALACVFAVSVSGAVAASEGPDAGELMRSGRVADAVPLLTLSLQQPDATSSCAAAESLVAAHRALGDPFRARPALEQSAAGATSLPCTSAVALARLQTADGDLDAARATLARIDAATNDAGALALADVERARIAWIAEKTDDARGAIGSALQHLGANDAARSAHHALALLRVTALMDGAAALRDRETLARVHSAVRAGLAARDTQEPVAATHYLLSAARVYRLSGRTAQALNAARRATISAQRSGASDLEYLALAELGTQLAASGDTAGATRVFDAALLAFDRGRLTLVADALLEPAGVRGYAGRAFLEYSGMLLKDGAGGDESRRWRALDVMERYKRAELEEFFLNACNVAPKSESGEALARRLAAGSLLVYPIVLADRIEVLSWDGTALSQHTVGDARELDGRVRALRLALTDPDPARHRPLAERLYADLLKPVAALGAAKRVVVVPDGALRLIPWPALHDGSQYVIEKLPVTSAPLLVAVAERTDATPRDGVLVAGLTEAVQGFPALPGVAREIEGLTGTLGGRTTVLTDRAFDAAAVEAGVAQHAPSVVHLATHGEIGRRADQSYLLTYTDRVRFDDLDRVLRGQPLDLVALSACQTASGDDRAALGLGGIALQAGADRVLATLWYVSDSATSELMQDFYRRLAKERTAAPEALRQAQIALLRTERYAHPAYWAPYVMVERVGAR